MERFSVKGNSSQTIQARVITPPRLNNLFHLWSKLVTSRPTSHTTRQWSQWSSCRSQQQLQAPHLQLSLECFQWRASDHWWPQLPGSPAPAPLLGVRYATTGSEMLRAGPISLHAVHCSPGPTAWSFQPDPTSTDSTVAVGMIILVCDQMNMSEWLILLVIIWKISRLDRVITSYDDLFMLIIAT